MSSEPIELPGFFGLVPLHEDHLDQLERLEAECGDVHWSRSQFEKELHLQISRFFVVHTGDHIVAYGGYWKVQDEAQVTNLVVRSEVRRRGVGRFLMERLLSQARLEGCRKCTLEVRETNSAALALYQRLGFGETGRRAKGYENPASDAVLMEKRL